MTLSDVGCDYYLLFLLPCIDTLWRVLSLRYVLDIPSDIENPSHSIGDLLFRAALEATDCSSVGQPCAHSIAAITPSYTQQFVRSGTRFTINSLIRTRMKRFIHVLPRSFCTSMWLLFRPQRAFGQFDDLIRGEVGTMTIRLRR